MERILRLANRARGPSRLSVKTFGMKHALLYENIYLHGRSLLSTSRATKVYWDSDTLFVETYIGSSVEGHNSNIQKTADVLYGLKHRDLFAGGQSLEVSFSCFTHNRLLTLMHI